jgi:glycosyltransferase involved in cell wall biosynthesis
MKRAGPCVNRGAFYAHAIDRYAERMRPMRVLLLVTDLERGGTPLRLARLAGGLRDAGLEVYVGCLARPGPVSQRLDAVGIPNFGCGARGVRDVGALWRLARHVRRIRPDLIHSTLTHANVAARIVGRLCRVPVVTSTATIEIERRWHATAERATRPLDRGHIVNSQAVAEHVRRAFHYPSDRIFVVPPSIGLAGGLAAPEAGGRQQPVDTVDRAAVRRQLGIGKDEFAVLWAGRLDPVKRIDMVLECAERLRAEPFRFLIAGEGPERRKVEQALRRRDAGRVQWLGWRDDLDAVMTGADVLLFPSLTEGMPNVVLQAMASGLPVIGSNIPALRELSGDERRLRLVRQADAGAFVAAIRSLRDDPQQCRELADRAASWAVANLDPQQTISAVIRAYETVLARGR